MNPTKLSTAVLNLEIVLEWVAPIVDGRHDQWKADRLREAIKLAKEHDQKIVERITHILSSQRFANWYGDNGDFGMWIAGEEISAGETIHESEIKENIRQMFLKDI